MRVVTDCTQGSGSGDASTGDGSSTWDEWRRESFHGFGSGYSAGGGWNQEDGHGGFTGIEEDNPNNIINNQ